MEGDPNVGSSSPSAIKKRKKPSAVWEEMIKHIEADGKVKAECKHCKKTFDGSSKKGTTHLKNHLQRCRANNNKRKSGSDGRDRDDQHQSLSASIKTKELASLIKEKSLRGLIKHWFDPEGHTGDEECEDWPDLDPWVLNSRNDEILQLYQEEKEKLCQFLNNLSCRFTLRLAYCDSDLDDGCLLEVNYIDDSWERQSKIISFWQCPHDHIKNLTEAVKQSCMDWKIDTNICSLLLSLPIDTTDGLDNEIGKMESWFSQRRSLPFAGCLLDTYYLWQYVDSVLLSEDYVRDGIRSLKECAAYVHNQSTSDKLIQLDSLVEIKISILKDGPSGTRFLGFYWYFEAAVGVKEVFSALEQFDSEFRSINLSKQKWDEVTATFEHLKFLYRDISFFWTKGDIPIIVDLPYVHKILKDRCNHTIEDCLFCQKVMKEAIDLFFSKNYSVRVIAVILDPRLKMDGVRLHYKEIYGSDADIYIEKVNKDFRDVYDAYAATDTSSSKSYRMLDATSSPKSELDLYMKELKVPAVEQFNILAWWRGNAPFYPTLARMARDYLALEITFDVEGALMDLLCDLEYINYKFKFCDLPEIITHLLCLKGILSSAEN
ncbi:zinc finger BED domain-containing protein RICESLEEPER 1-like isoform X2 [Citrus sinensis]|uniref:zinc finger BED domain-containing protein RICESLEEPER 1-like isoform X2 n=1 Tax=Citrus sinensis TaxID=2711 RepID=UPI00227767E4|nr:zinc finger BED domain-containing protein RICESLEEPER 1-like isoform X2 [Citrus sinensis]XP_052293947.1 zinc finger BED domain-containing protein RICESLEEPER 1-like isoform X2 [Citrus sinensis]XP_052293948.1 zinc finger BED domain-containing protein RICESLEEPER 1-like isoform X2 [Citrus sinensis]